MRSLISKVRILEGPEGGRGKKNWFTEGTLPVR
jgi:hypothetical protein